jgi:hypothetical protein
MPRVQLNVGAPARPAPVRDPSLVDRPFLKLMLVRKQSGTGRGTEKVAAVCVDREAMLVFPTPAGEPARFVRRANADKHYAFVRYLRPDENVVISGTP